MNHLKPLNPMNSLISFYITTSIAYTNAKPHIGYALELIQADCLARFYRQKYGSKNLFFLTGTDDHGIKIYRSAKKAGQSPQDFVRENILAFRNLIKKLSITNDGFISTSDTKLHWPGAQKLWKALNKKGDIYKKKYKGLYCPGCEAFLTKRDLVDGKCPNHDKKPEVIEEENYFFRLTRYKDQIIQKIKRNELKIIPESRKNEILNILSKLEDVSFSRPKDKLPWGVPVPSDDSQVMYVWCDALSNYLTGLGYGQKDKSKFGQYWPANIHCIGKDILRFHAAIWPAMLLSAGLTLPKTIFVHGWITSEGKKMSKSLGNIVDPVKLIEKYGSDAVRYYLLKEIPATDDGDFSKKRFEEVYNGELANELGNLTNRIIKMSKRYNIKIQSSNVKSNPKSKIQNFKIDKFVENFQFREVLRQIWQYVRSANEYIEKNKPWELAKNNPKKLKQILGHSVDMLRVICYMLQFFLPETSEKIKKQLKTLRAEPLFPRIK